MDRPPPEFDDHQWLPPPPPPPQPFHDRDYPPPPPPPPSHGGGFHPSEPHRHSHHHNRQARRHDYQNADDFRGFEDEQYHNYNAGPPPDEWFGANGELGQNQGHSRPHHLPRKRRAPIYDDGNYVKVFVGGVPNTVMEEDVRLLFEEYGSVVEVVLCWDKRTGQQKEYCFVKYASFEEADNAIRALHDQYIWPGTIVPVRVKYADGEKERLGANKQKVYVNNMNKQASKEEVAEIFSHYGTIEEIYIMVDEFKQSRGCGFVGFSHRDMALAAIEGLNGSFMMRGCDRPLVVRFADPKKPRQGELRSAPTCGSIGTSPAASHVDNRCPSVENAANIRSGTPVMIHSHHNAVHEPHYHQIHPRDSQAIDQFSRPEIKSQPAAIAPAKKNAILPPSQSAVIAPAKNAILPPSQSAAIAPAKKNAILPPSQSAAIAPAKKNAILTPSQLTSEGTLETGVVEGIPNCDWSEHVCPDGYKYYYNCMTYESRWEKPEELALHEQKLQNLSGQQPPSISHALAIQCKRQSSYPERSDKPVSCSSEYSCDKVQLERSPAMSPPII